MACYQLVKSTIASGAWRIPKSTRISSSTRRASARCCWRNCSAVPGKLEDLGDRIVIKHLYMERRMTPLNLYLEQANDQQMRDAIERVR